MMNVDDEEEYVDFYDFSKAYENHPLLIRDKKPKQLQNVKEKKEEDEESWEECDEKDFDSDEDGKINENQFEIKINYEKSES